MGIRSLPVLLGDILKVYVAYHKQQSESTELHYRHELTTTLPAVENTAGTSAITGLGG